MSDLSVEEQGLSPFGLLEKKVVKEGATDFQNVAYLTIQMSSSLNEIITVIIRSSYHLVLSGVIFSPTLTTLPFSVKELCWIPSFLKLQKIELILFSLPICCEVHSNHYNNS